MTPITPVIGPIHDTCDCGKKVDCAERQEIVWDYKMKQFYRRCGDCIKKFDASSATAILTSNTTGHVDPGRKQ